MSTKQHSELLNTLIKKFAFDELLGQHLKRTAEQVQFDLQHIAGINVSVLQVKQSALQIGISL
ncbi:hypothetical protein VQ643_09640 [Pseudomonas sp. F1_0610]|uniref:hypothetical protein n=1 Tax=Pseudomonas sp. F1_0610 TaxID=3114284 RepID=UPI0039C044AF